MIATLLLVSGLILGAPPSRPPDPSDPRLRPAVADPNDPEKTRPTVFFPEEREKLGLTPKTWSGVVDPDVYPRLDKLTKTVTTLKDRLNKKKGRDEEAFQALGRIRFKGMVYVQVQLKDKDAQRRVLAGLKASEFHAPFLFDKAAGLTGYATKDALDKLAKTPDVTGFCLDDKPLPGPGMRVFKHHLPAAKAGEAGNEPGVTEGKVDPDVYRAFALTDRVYVSVNLREETLPQLTDVPSEMRARIELREEAARKLQDSFLSTVSADELWVLRRSTLGSAVSGYTTREGLQKLWRHPDMQRIVLPSLAKIPERRNGTHFSP